MLPFPLACSEEAIRSAGAREALRLCKRLNGPGFEERNDGAVVQVRWARFALLAVQVAVFSMLATACSGRLGEPESLARGHGQGAAEVAGECVAGEPSGCAGRHRQGAAATLMRDLGMAPPPDGAQRAGAAGETVDMTLQDAVAHTLQFNRDLLRTRLGRAQAKLSLELTEDTLRPRYDVKFTPSFNARATDGEGRDFQSAGLNATLDTTATLPFPTGGSVSLNLSRSERSAGTDDGSITLRLSQPLLKGAGREIATANVTQARLSEESNVLSVSNGVAALVVSVEREYRSLIKAYEQVEIAEAALQRARDQHDLTRTLIEAGRTARRELVRSEATIANRELSLGRARNGLEAANFSFTRILGMNAGVRVRPLDKVRVGQLEAGQLARAALPPLDEVLQRRTDFRQAEIGLEIARINLAVAENNLLPGVSLGVSVSRQDDGRTNSSLDLGTTIALNDKALKNAHLSARVALLEAEWKITDLRESISFNLRRAASGVQEALRVIELAGDARELAEENVEIERGKFDQGLSSASEVSSVGDELVQAERAEVDAMFAYLDALTTFDQETGRVLERRGIRLDAVLQ